MAAALALAAILAEGCAASLTPTATPASIATVTPTAQVSPTNTAASFTVRPSASLSPIDGMIVFPVPSNVVLAADIPDSPGVQAGGTPSGPYAYLTTSIKLGTSEAVGLFVADAGGGSERPVAVPLAANDQIDPVLVGDGWIVVLVGHSTAPPPTEGGVPCNGTEGFPIVWRILVARLGANGEPSTPWRTLDQGTARRRWGPPGAGEWCYPVQTPPVAIAADRLAYAIESATSATPDASTVVLRSLADGSVVRTYAASQQVEQVVLSTTDVAWTQSANIWSASTNTLIEGQSTPDWRVMTVSLTDTAARQVPSSAPSGEVWPSQLTIDGSAVIDSSDWLGVARVGEDDRARTTVIDPGVAGRTCTASGADDGLVLLACQDEAGQAWTAVWTAATGMRALSVLGTTDTGFQSLQDGWLLLDHYDYARQQSMLLAVPETSLR